MPKAPSKCLETGCRLPATTKGRCQKHYVPWTVTSARNQARPTNAASLIRRVRFRDKERCYVCGRPGRAVDHIVPIAEQGTWDMSNLACICDACHETKSAQEAARGRSRHR